MPAFQLGRSALRSALIAVVLAPWITNCGGTSGSEKAKSPQLGSGGSAAAGSSGSVAMTGSGGSENTGKAPAPGSGGKSGGTSGAGGSSTGSSGAGGATVPTDADGGVLADAAVPVVGSSGPFPPVTDLSADGPFTSTEMDSVGPNSNYTLYLPTELAPNGAKNPIVVWMSGGGTGPALYPLLPHLATHGFVVLASDTIPGIGDEVELGQELVAGIDWAIMEDQRADSMLFGKLDETKIAAIGYSMGSLATFTMANDPRLTTTVHISGGNMEADRVNNLHAPAAFLCGIPGDDSCDILSDTCDIAGANCATDFMNATTPVFYGVFSYGHLGILTDPYTTQIGSVATAWLRWKLMSDSTLAPMFVGDQCTLCKDSNWKVQEKGDLQ